MKQTEYLTRLGGGAGVAQRADGLGQQWTLRTVSGRPRITYRRQNAEAAIGHDAGERVVLKGRRRGKVGGREVCKLRGLRCYDVQHSLAKRLRPAASREMRCVLRGLLSKTGHAFSQVTTAIARQPQRMGSKLSKLAQALRFRRACAKCRIWSSLNFAQALAV